VYPDFGSDGTGDGSQSRPFASLQAAYNAGKRVIYLGEGNAGILTTTASVTMVLTGLGRTLTQVGQIYTGGFNLTLLDGGLESFELTSGIITNSNVDGTPGGDLVLERLYGPSAVINATGVNGNTDGVDGGNSGSVVARNCRFASVSANGGTGGPGTAEMAAGDGGSGGVVTLEDCRILTNVDGSKGNAGSDNGGGPGVDGSDGTLSARQCDLESIGTFASQSTIACIIGGTFTP
jgi:hypothetical protein